MEGRMRKSTYSSKVLDLAAYLHKYSRNYDKMTFISLGHQKITRRGNVVLSISTPSNVSSKILIQSPVLAIAEQDRTYRVICGGSDFSIGCALMQYGK